MYIYSANARWRGRRDKAVFKNALLGHECPVYSNDALFRKALQRFGKNQIPRFLAFPKADYPEISSAFALENGHHAVFLNFGLKMAVSEWLLPQRVDLRLTAVFNNLREACCLDLKKFHCESRASQTE